MNSQLMDILDIIASNQVHINSVLWVLIIIYLVYQTFKTHKRPRIIRRGKALREEIPRDESYTEAVPEVTQEDPERVLRSLDEHNFQVEHEGGKVYTGLICPDCEKETYNTGVFKGQNDQGQPKVEIACVCGYKGERLL